MIKSAFRKAATSGRWLKWTPRLARHVDNDRVELPLGLFALVWLRLYLPLVAANLPHMPANRGADGLGFAGDGFRALLGGVIPRLDLRLGARFSGDAAQVVHAALRDATTTITRMPANYMTYPNGGVILPVTRASPRQRIGLSVITRPCTGSRDAR